MTAFYKSHWSEILQMFGWDKRSVPYFVDLRLVIKLHKLDVDIHEQLSQFDSKDKFHFVKRTDSLNKDGSFTQSKIHGLQA